MIALAKQPAPVGRAGLSSSLGRIFAMGRPYRRTLFSSFALWTVSAFLALMVPLGVRGLVDTAFVNADRAMLNRTALALLGVLLAQAAVSFGAGYLLAWAGERMVADFRRRIYEHLHRLSLSFFNEQRTGDLTARLNSDVESVRSAVALATTDLLTVGLRTIGSVALLVAISWRLGLVVLLVVPAASAISRALGGRIRDLSRDVQDRLADSTSIAQETISGIRVVMAFGRGGHEVGRYAAAVERLFEAARRRDLTRALFTALLTILAFFPTAALFWFGGMEVLAGRLTPGDLIASFLYANNLAQGVGNLAGIYVSFNSAVGASERVLQLLDTPPEIEDAPGAVALPPVAGHLRLEGVRFGYQDAAPVLRGVDLEIRPGEVVALVGPSGAGKTTLLHLLLRFMDPAEGRLLLDGHDLRDVRLMSLREQLALVSQDVQLFNDSVRENIRYGRLDATDAEVEEAARAANAHTFITALPGGYGTVVGERGVKLSGGQRQRISIARALLKGAPVLLLDEATSSLDSESEQLVKQALERLMRGRTSLVVAHRLATVRDADRILVLEEGCVVEEGTHAELAGRQGLYSRLAAGQFAAV